MPQPFTKITPDASFLEWDSRFFRRKIGKLSLNSQTVDSLNAVLENAREQQYALLYVFCEDCLELSQDVLHTFNGQLVDQKVIYELRLDDNATSTVTSVKDFDSSDDKDTLYKLALQSGEYSRFRIDEKIGKTNFKRLYKRWIDNSISRALADGVFVHKTGNAINGFITLGLKGDTGIIGLIATDKNHRAKGIGTALLDYVKKYAVDSGMVRLEVVTQGRNEKACRFYEKNRFIKKNDSKVYHFWL